MITGKILRDAFISGAVTIANKKRDVDILNVYPVPDGDTGTNMSMTMSNALRELQFLEDTATVSQVAETTAAALLRGARGNSGVILSLIFRGFARSFKDKITADCEDFRLALELGVEGAYKAVMTPTEGTILTVARLASEKANETVKTTNDVVALWSDVCLEAKAALDNTPNQLPVLKKAGVVDAGGMGLYVIWTAILDVLKGGEPAKPVDAPKTDTIGAPSDTTVGDFDEEITHTYCTEFIVRKNADCKDASLLRAFLETIGDCVVAVDDDDIIKVHVHTEHPGQAIEEGLLFGSLINLKIDNMRYQHENKMKEAAAAKKQKQQKFTPAAPEKPFGFVAVASGAGIEELFRNLGADCIVRGGQTMNPSTDDILQAIMATPAETVFVLPNNKNIIMAAEQAVKLADRKVCVLQSRTIPQGITAMMNYDPDADFDTNRLNMTKSLDRVSTGLITFAARDSDFEGHNIKKGEILALDNGKLAFAEKDISKAAYKLTKRLADGNTSFITIIHGADVSESKAEELYQRVSDKFDDAEVMLINGGQPVYYYIISVE
ncbi:MAG: DAK2 domain-containing protein [Oscillospiraceae bacterium]|nr:DAK2 domain-containing protein [Oscillospiraceae bacterium]